MVTTRGVAQTFAQMLVGILVLYSGMFEGRGVDLSANRELAWVCSRWC